MSNSAVTGQLIKVGNFLIRDLGDRKVYGVKTALISRVQAVESPLEMPGSQNTPQGVPQTQRCEHLSDDTRAQRCSPDKPL